MRLVAHSSSFRIVGSGNPRSRAADVGQAVRVRLAIAPLVSRALGRLKEETQLPVIADSLDLAVGMAGEIANGESFGLTS